MLSIRTVPRLIRCLIVSKNAEIKLLMFRAEFHCLYSYSVRIKFGKKGNIFVQIINQIIIGVHQPGVIIVRNLFLDRLKNLKQLDFYVKNISRFY